DDDLAAGQPAVALWAADLEAAGRIDVEDGAFVKQAARNRRPYDLLDDLLADLALRHAASMVGGHHHGVHPLGLHALVLHGHLALAVGTQPGDLTRAPRLRQT